MNKKNVAILYGGRSGEHEVSLLSASSVEKHLDKKLYNVHLIGITKKGLWYYQEEYNNTSDRLDIIEDPNKLVSLIPGKGLYVSNSTLDIEFIFPILHGTFGEDGTLQGLLELIDIPYAGSGLDGSFMAMDKEYAKIIWEREGLPIVPFIGVKKHVYTSDPESIKNSAQEKFSYPMFVKPVQVGSSVGVSRVNSENDFHKAVKNAFLFDQKILIEPAINAREIECSVIGNENPIAYSLGEISSTHEFYDYDAKYFDPKGAKLMIPADLDPEKTNKLREMAKEAYLALNLKGFSRVDFFLDKESGDVMINEINTIPGFTNKSMFSMLCGHGGLDYSSLLNEIYKYGMERYKERQKLVFDNIG